ncbi:HIT family protein [Gayadomonas joobiniege]|uniref:HIT family protein n=1 Tax=Gayadomonas joobiniege TaxID=1234606 RepID=UPI0003612E61|nr:HIT family protein [Gayadomonas joobiniege]
MSFLLDSRLKRECFEIADLELSKLLLMNNRSVPWLILVPRVEMVDEIVDLRATEQAILMDEINLVSKIIQKQFSPDKLNTAAIGNMVRQLHIHIVGRYVIDPAWPAPVWGNLPVNHYHEGEAQQRIQLLRHAVCV